MKKATKDLLKSAYRTFMVALDREEDLTIASTTNRQYSLMKRIRKDLEELTQK